MKSLIESSLSLVSILVLASGCGQGVDLSQTAQGSTPFNHPGLQGGDCAGAAIQGQYIVSWKNGKITREHSRATRRSFVILSLRTKIKSPLPSPICESQFRRTSTPSRARDPSRKPTVKERIRINAGAAWSQGAYGNGTIVAVVDTGIDRTHPGLAQQLALNAGEMGSGRAGAR